MSGRFDEWESVVDCNDCSHYHNDTCDGVKVGSKRNCQSFVATRATDLPQRVSKLERELLITERFVTAWMLVQIIEKALRLILR